jgi:ribosomal protein S12 methylthiotransferase
VRLHYVYPYPNVDDLIPLMAAGKILPYLDIPFQHASPTILKAMRRPGDQEKLLERIANWRRICPDLTLRSTFIVGFPGETDDDFEQLLHFMRQASLDRVGCFEYSPVEGASANALANPVPDEIKKARWERFMAVQQAISTERLQRKVGTVQEMIVDGIEDGIAFGRTRADAPEIDGQITLDGDYGLQPGHRLNVKITDADEYDLWGEPAEFDE